MDKWRENLIIRNLMNEMISCLSETTQIGRGDEDDENLYFRWKKVNETTNYFGKFYRTQKICVFKIEHNFGRFPDLFLIENEIDKFYASFMEKQLENLDDEDMISVSINNHELNGKPVFIPPTSKKNFDKQSFFNSIYEVSQSNTSFLLEDYLTFNINFTKTLKGGGKRAPKSLSDIEKYSRSIIPVNNYDRGCAFRALAICIAKLETKGYLWECIRRDTNNEQTLRAEKLAKLCGFDLNHDIYINDFNIIQKFIEYNITIIDDNDNLNRLFVGENRHQKKIFILYRSCVDGTHYDPIINIKGYLKARYYCEHCHSIYTHKFDHSCEFLCEHCFQAPKCEVNEIVYCNDCNFSFKNNNCFMNHLHGVCKVIRKCSNCDVKITEKNHNCDVKICKICNEKYSFEKHYCCIKKLDIEKLKQEDKNNKIIVAYDIESQLNGNDGNIYTHTPNLLISMTTCDKCWTIKKENIEFFCDVCRNFKNIFIGKTCVRQFGDYIYEDLALAAQQTSCEILAFAHNAKGYDNHFVLNDLFARSYKDVHIIMSGTKILRISVGNVKYLDSLSIFQQPLSNLPKAFGFDDKIKKGIIPYFMFNKDSVNYEGEIPDKIIFRPDFMKLKQLNEFEKWYENNKHFYLENKYNLLNEVLSYCENDTYILLLCVQKFREIYKNITGIDPITRNFTLASMGLEIFRSKIMPKNSIGVTPITNYNLKGNYSRVSQAWLDFQSKIHGTVISREVNIDKYIVDGLIKSKKIIFEYNGCHYHNNNCCNSGKTKDFNVKRNHLLKRGFNIIEETDCNFMKKRKIDNYLHKYIQSRIEHYKLLEKHGGVNIRESFFGGRTNNIKFHCDILNNPDKKILYYDFRSLYPFVLKYKYFPLGHPEVINENFKNVNDYFGFMKCIVLPPKHLRYPVLPYRLKNKKLVFPLCKTCADERLQGTCIHNDAERMLIGSWSTMELGYALEKGYKIMHILQVYHYEQKDNTIFKEYIDMWLKFKVEADGWPNWVKNEEDKKVYIKNFFEKEGISLNVENIFKNPALRFIAKLFLNTLWGKFAQRLNLTQTKICYEYKDYYEVLNDVNKVIKGELMVNDNCLLINWEYVNDDFVENKNTAIAISSFVTSYARIELHRKMEEIDKERNRLLYVDTDSMIFEYAKGEDKPMIGDYLGDLSDEIAKDYGDNAICTKFCSLGPKVYALEIWPENCDEPITIFKIKGLTIYKNTLDIISFKIMVDLADEYVKNEGKTENCSTINIPQMKIFADKLHMLETHFTNKKLRVFSEKRRIKGNDTLPYGFVDEI